MIMKKAALYLEQIHLIANSDIPNKHEKLSELITIYSKYCNELGYPNKINYDDFRNKSYIIESTPLFYDLNEEDVKNAFLHLSKEQFDDILDDINRLMQYSEENVYHYNLQAAFSFQIICKFCIYYRATTLPKKNIQAKNSYAPMIVFAIEFMKKNLAQKITIETIAQELSISAATFQRYFLDIMKISPMEYLTKLRIKQSKKLLRTTDKAIVFIAYECGFYDSPHFFRQFKKHEGITPTEYRKISTQKNLQ